MLNDRQKTIPLNIVASPFFLALPIILLLILFLPNPSSKYKIELSSKKVANKPNSKVQFCDLNNDGKDERLISFHNAVKGEAAIKVLTNDGMNYDVWNFNGYFQKAGSSFYCADINNDNYSEIYIFYYKDDSVFLGVIQPYPNKEILVQKKFITTVLLRNGNIDFCVSGFSVADLNNNGKKELVFLLNAGYSRQPRAIFAYDNYDDTIFRSESFGIFFSGLVIVDLDGDAVPEIYSGSSTPGNIPDSMDILLNDYNSWYSGFDNNLKPLFDPLINMDYHSSVHVCKFESDEGKKYIAASFINYNKKLMTINFFDSADNVFSTKKFINLKSSKSVVVSIMTNVKLYGKNYILVGSIDNEFVLINEALEIVRKPVYENSFSLHFIEDLNKDGNNEALFLSEERKIVIYDNALNNPTSIETGILPNNTILNTGIKHNGIEQDEIYLKTDNYLYLYTYSEDYFYYLRYPLWIITYLLIVFILWSAQRIQKIQFKRKQQIEETINSLQMKVIKSQMDPHFMFNVLNGLANNVAAGNSKEAYNQIIRFSILLRSLMKRTDKIYVSLEEEIGFVKRYLELEKFRFKDDFEFQINIENDINRNIRFPRMLIQLLVENSIKHGLRNKQGIKKLLISISCPNNGCLITVEDNGVGRKEAMQKTRDSGKGTHLINDMIKLNHKLGGKNINLKYTDLYDESGKASGTMVQITFV